MYTSYGISFNVQHADEFGRELCEKCISTADRVAKAYVLCQRRVANEAASMPYGFELIAQAFRVLGRRQFDYAAHLRDAHGFSELESSNEIWRIQRQASAI